MVVGTAKQIMYLDNVFIAADKVARTGFGIDTLEDLVRTTEIFLGEK